MNEALSLRSDFFERVWGFSTSWRGEVGKVVASVRCGVVLRRHPISVRAVSGRTSLWGSG